MNKKVLERKLVVVLFVLVLVVFSLAERDSRKIERLYTTAQLLKNNGKVLPELAVQSPASRPSNHE
jgi:hypothetical protein